MTKKAMLDLMERLIDLDLALHAYGNHQARAWTPTEVDAYQAIISLIQSQEEKEGL